MHQLKDRAAAFDGIAARYGRCRPGYPDALRERIEALAWLAPGAALLEVGVGAGQATRLFVGRGYRLVGVEPGDRLAEVARQALPATGEVTIEKATFESWEPAGRRFDLIFSGSAFHWVDPAVGFPKAGAVLEAGGSLALFWNMYPEAEDPLFPELQAIYRAHAPQLADRRFAVPMEGQVLEHRRKIEESGGFADLTVHRFPWSVEYSTAGFLDLLSTYSDHALLDPAVRDRLYAAITALAEARGGTVVRPFCTVLFHARKP